MIQELGGKFRYDMLEVEMPFGSHGVRFSPMVMQTGIYRTESTPGEDSTGKSLILRTRLQSAFPPTVRIDFPTGNAILGLRGLVKVTPSAVCPPDLSSRLLDSCLFKPSCRNPLHWRRKERQNGFYRSRRLACRRRD